jgi:hypothetical protein
MAIRAKLAALSCAVLGGLLLLVGGAKVAAAHPGHDHAPAAVSAPHAAVQMPAEAAEQRDSQHLAVLEGSVQSWAGVHLSTKPATAPQPLHAGNCCCGSIACHAGVQGPDTPFVHRYSSSQRFDLPRVLPMPKSPWGGIERPPRAPFAL